MRLISVIVLILVGFAPVVAAPAVPSWEKMEVVGAQAGGCGPELPYILVEARGAEQPYLLVFYIFDEDRPFALYDPKTDTVFLDLARDGVFERAGAPGDQDIGEGPCDSLPWALAVKPAK